MAESYSSLSKYQRLISYGVIALQLLVLLCVAIVSAFNISIPHQVLISFVVAPLCIAGIIYALVGFKPLLSANRQLALFGLIAPLILAILIYCYADGGVVSAAYAVWLVLLAASGILGYGAADIAISIGIGYYLLMVGVSLASGQTLYGSWEQALATVIAMAVSYLLAEQTEQIEHSRRLTRNLSGQLEGEQSKTELMMEAIADAVIGVNQSRQIVVFNAAAEHLTGWDKASALDINYINVLGLHDPSDQPMNDKNDPFMAVLADNKPHTVNDYYVIGPNETKITFSIASAPTHDGEGNITGAIAIFHDISEQKALQRERNEFVSTASHEMRTPVAAIEGYLSMAVNPKLAQIDDKARDYIDKAHQASMHLGKLFQDLLSVTKLEDKRLVDERTEFDIGELVDGAVEAMQPIAQAKGLQLTAGGVDSAINPGSKVLRPLAIVEADRDRVQEVITNFIDNAVKYTPKGSVTVKLDQDDTSATVSVIDTGMGISPEEQTHLFQKFYRVNNSMTREIGGTGLGLYISRGLIERYGGTTGVESTLGQGSRFYFSLPLKKHSQLAATPKEHYNSPIARETQ